MDSISFGTKVSFVFRSKRLIQNGITPPKGNSTRCMESFMKVIQELERDGRDEEIIISSQGSNLGARKLPGEIIQLLPYSTIQTKGSKRGSMPGGGHNGRQEVYRNFFEKVLNT